MTAATAAVMAHVLTELDVVDSMLRSTSAPPTDDERAYLEAHRTALVGALDRLETAGWQP